MQRIKRGSGDTSPSSLASSDGTVLSSQERLVLDVQAKLYQQHALPGQLVAEHGIEDGGVEVWRILQLVSAKSRTVLYKAKLFKDRPELLKTFLESVDTLGYSIFEQEDCYEIEVDWEWIDQVITYRVLTGLPAIGPLGRS